MTGDPRAGCVKLECVDNPDCPAGRSCLSNKCRDVCSLDGVCGANSDCTTINNAPFCACKPGYTGDPRIGCSRITICVSDVSCPANMKCAFGVCSRKLRNQFEHYYVFISGRVIYSVTPG